MARQCQKELEQLVATKWDIDVMPGKANVEVRPTFINKGEIAKRLVQMYHMAAPPGTSDATPNTVADENGKIEFAICMGDDFTDEDMFRSLNGLVGPVLDANHVFTVTVGASTKVTLARWHLLEPEDVIEVVALLAGIDRVEGVDALGEVNFAALKMIDG